jgi:hypothetical protein
MDFLIAVAASVLGAVLIWLAVRVWQAWRKRQDRRRVHAWLRSNTRDEPGHSHVTVGDISKGTHLSDQRCTAACEADPRILQSRARGELWSIWRQEPQSVYEKRGPLVF